MNRNHVLTAFAVLSLQTPEILGSWHGRSTCVDRAHFPACRDEEVIYDVRAHPGTRDTVTLRADKVVNGQRESMGELDFTKAPDSSWVAEFQTPRAHDRWVFRVSGARMTGTLTDLTSGRQIREVVVERVQR